MLLTQLRLGRIGGAFALLTAITAFWITLPLGAQQESFLPGSPIPIPPVLQPSRVEGSAVVYELTAAPGSRAFVADAETATLGYNGDYLGPTIRVDRGQDVDIRVTNGLSEATTVHWHGAHLPAEADGGPHQIIPPGDTWTASFLVDQEAATLWYHPHLMGTTAEQVYEGLAGFLIVEDEVSDSLALPREYGVNDIPVVLQERRFGRDGRFRYRPAMPDIMHGYFGNALLTNGVIEPYLEVTRGILRLRLLNGSNSTILRLSLNNGAPFHQIAGDGGFLEAPVRLEQIILSPGERAEVLVDFSAGVAASTRDPRGTRGAPAQLLAETNAGGQYVALEFRRPKRISDSGEIPDRLRSRNSGLSTEGVRRRRFLMSTMGPGGRLTINGKLMDMDRIDEEVTLGTTEIWDVVNDAMGRGMMGPMGNVPHNFHVHGLQFFILSINGAPPPPELAGPKDTVLLWPGDRVELVLRFTDYTGIYMYHCHLLEHEDEGMMGQFLVTEAN